MAARKLQQEVDKCFKKVAEGVAEFEAIYEKIEQSNNPAQKEKLEDNLKREIKKLQRQRDQIKTWAASNDIKDKGPLLEHRKLIETQMERFKAVEKAMKTKAYSKEGLSAAAKLDPKEQAKADASDFLSSMVDELEQQIESLEAESETLQATMKKGKNKTAQAERIETIENTIERHKWHQGRMELIRRSLDNGRLEAEQVMDLEESIRYYVTDNMNDDFMDDDEMYDDLNLDEEEDAYGMNQDNDRVSSQDTQSIQEDHVESEVRSLPASKSRAAAEARRPSAQLKSPLPSVAMLHTPSLPTIPSGGPSGSVGNMKPASIPTRPAEGLKYASAAAAAAASDKIGIAPLPPPPGAPGISPLPPIQAAKASATNSPVPMPALPASGTSAAGSSSQVDNSTSLPKSALASVAPPPAKSSPNPEPSKAKGKKPATPEPLDAPKGKPTRNKQGPSVVTQSQSQSFVVTKTNGTTNGTTNGLSAVEENEDEESIYHLPASLQDLVEALDSNKKRQVNPCAPANLRMLARSQESKPMAGDGEPRSTYRPDQPYNSPSGYPTEPLSIFENPALYSRIDPDTLFYVFYYKQGTYQQYLAAKALKDQSWRFHKQYQTWFQRHEEPKAITEEFEQGTYRFFDYESTWMNRRKADFKFHYKYLEDDV